MSRLPLLSLLILPLLAPAADWPVADGPLGTNVAPLADGATLVDDLANVKLLWKSAERIPTTYGTDGRKCSAKRSQGYDVGSGYSSPVVADGKVFLYYHRPGGDAVDAGAVAKSLKNGGWGRTTWVAEADAVVHCFDAATGATLWKRVYPREGPQIDVGFNKGGGHFLCQVVAGKLYVYTNGGNLRCLDPATGMDIWSRDVGARALSAELIRQKGVEDQSLMYFNRHFKETPAVDGGVVAMSDGREDTGMRGQGGHALSGFDAVTGEVLWHLPEGTGDTATPWRHGDDWFFLCFGEKGLTCIEADTGRTRWNLPGMGGPGPALATDGNRILVPCKEPGAKTGHVICLELSPGTAPEELWRVPGEVDHGNHAFVGDRVFIVDSDTGLRSVEAATSKVLAKVEGWNPEHMGIVVTGDLLLGPERNGVRVFRLGDAGAITPLGMLVMPIATCTRIAVADGRMYVRCKSRVHCYDLLKR